MHLYRRKGRKGRGREGEGGGQAEDAETCFSEPKQEIQSVELMPSLATEALHFSPSHSLACISSSSISRSRIRSTVLNTSEGGILSKSCLGIPSDVV